MSRRIIAHSVPGRPVEIWESLRDHSGNVAEGSAANAEAFGCGPLGRVAGLLHDIGKVSAEFQAYVHASGDRKSGPNHAYAGALVARERLPKAFGTIVAAIVAGHHAGLADGSDLEDRLKDARLAIPPFDGWEAEIGPLPDASAYAGMRLRRSIGARGFSLAFLIRMLFSALVDADSIGTGDFYAKIDGRDPGRGGFTDLSVLHGRLEAHMARFAERAAGAEGRAAELNRLRAEILTHARAKAAEPPGLFTLTVPTGGGKTLTSLSFALDHAKRHGLRRIIYVIPFTSIIEQTAAVFREALGVGPDDADVLEHHASFDWDAKVSTAKGAAREGGSGIDARERLQRAAENWAAPVVVTTAVQFFESLFANRRTPCRKLHNIAGSVIVLDEAQSLPLHLLRPCMAAMEELATNYGASVVLCTATQPALKRQDGFEGGLDIPDTRELAPDPKGLFCALKRVEIAVRPASVGDEEIAARFADVPQMLCIVNRRDHAQALFSRIAGLPGAMHLSTLMCPAHRRAVLAEARARLHPDRNEPVRLVSTSLIEAGVDIDFPEVWRAAAGIDSVMQAAGRCNREGRLPGLGRVVVFEPQEGKPPHELKQAWEVGRGVLRHHADPQTIEAIHAYFSELYWTKGAEALDAATLKDERYPILERIADRTNAMTFPFESIAQAFRMIEDEMESVVVPWSSGPEDDMAATILARVGAMDRPLGADLRRLQQYVVAIPKRERDLWLATGVLKAVHPGLKDGLLRFEGLEHYDPRLGVRLGEPLARDAASNVV